MAMPAKPTPRTTIDNENQVEAQLAYKTWRDRAPKVLSAIDELLRACWQCEADYNHVREHVGDVTAVTPNEADALAQEYGAKAATYTSELFASANNETGHPADGMTRTTALKEACRWLASLEGLTLNQKLDALKD